MILKPVKSNVLFDELKVSILVLMEYDLKERINPDWIANDI